MDSIQVVYSQNPYKIITRLSEQVKLVELYNYVHEILTQIDWRNEDV